VKKPAKAGFFVSRDGKLVRTAFFVDGYNLYYGLLRGSPHKWLDLSALLDSILRVQEPSASLDSVHYFTALISKLATRGQLSNDAQHRYIRALQAKGVHVTLGKHRWNVDTLRCTWTVRSPPGWIR
jgi:hypothetical protein